MVGSDGIADVGFLLILFGNFGSVESVGEFALLVGHFSDVVQQSGSFGLLWVQSQFGSHHGAEIGCFAGVLQQILTVGRAVFHFSHDADEFGMQSVDAQVDGGAFSGFDNLVVELFFHFGHHFFDACGVDAPVGHQLVQSQAANLAANGVEG